MSKTTQVKQYIMAALVLLMSYSALYGQTSEADLRREFEEIKRRQQAIEDGLASLKAMQGDISEIKALLSRAITPAAGQKPAPPPQVNIKGVEFSVGGNPVIGSESAKLILVEFTDYQCPFCSRYARATFSLIKEKYVEEGIIQYAVIDRPLTDMHPEAAKAAESAHCAREQGKFWEMHKALMANQDELKNLVFYADALGLDNREFEVCLNSGKYKGLVEENTALAGRLGIAGVPGFIIGTVDASGGVKAVSFISGAQPFDVFRQALDEALIGQ